MRDDIFSANGGNFIISPRELQEKLKNIKAVLFDWDGVFNSGEKGGLPSSFSEVDSMGINMLRFGYFIYHGVIPYTAIVTGETNPAAFKWAKREGFNDVYFQVKHKIDLLHLLKEHQGIEAHEILFVFDDILDLSLAQEVGVRFLVHRKSNPLFNAFCIQRNLCDYMTYSSGKENAIREISEVALDGLGLFEQTVEERLRFEGIYQEFLQEKNSLSTNFLMSKQGSFQKKSIEDIL